jgi:hypothetical protein
MSALVEAVRELVAIAPPQTVRACLRLLLDDALPAQPIVQPAAPVARPSPMPRRKADRTPAADAEWRATIARIRDRMTELGASGAAIAREIGLAPSCVSVALQGKAASAHTRDRLRAWVDGTVPVVADAPPFRRRPGRPPKPAATTNGADAPA